MEFDCYSFGLPLREVPALAREAEEIGFSGMWFTESAHNPFLLSGAASMQTERLLVGTGIAVAFARSPMATAQAAWDLAQATGGRFVLGLGSQVKAHIERRFAMPFSKPAARLAEYVRAVRAIFRAFQGIEPLRFEGEFYRLTLLTDFFNSGPSEFPDVPIYISGVGTGMARAAGEVCDGLHVHPIHSPRYLREVLRPAVEAGASGAGRTLDDFTFAVPVFMIVGSSDEELERQRASVRRQMAFYGSTPAYRPVFDLHGWADVGEKLSLLQRQGEVERMPALITDEILDAFSVTAAWDQLASTLLTRYQGLADRVLPYGTAEHWRQRPELRARWAEVARAMREG